MILKGRSYPSRLQRKRRLLWRESERVRRGKEPAEGHANAVSCKSVYPVQKETNLLHSNADREAHMSQGSEMSTF